MDHSYYDEMFSHMMYRRDFASCYYPDISSTKAVRKLKDLIKAATDFHEELRKAGYRKCSRTLTPPVMTVLVKILGYP